MNRHLLHCVCWRGFFASLELAETWNKQFTLTSMDDAFKDAAGGNPGDVSVQSITVGRRRGWGFIYCTWVKVVIK